MTTHRTIDLGNGLHLDVAWYERVSSMISAHGADKPVGAVQLDEHVDGSGLSMYVVHFRNTKISSRKMHPTPEAALEDAVEAARYELEHIGKVFEELGIFKP